MHITDTLSSGGAERVAVNLVNLLPRDRYQAYLCTTRREGPLLDLVMPDVVRLKLQRRQRFDIRALRYLVTFIRAHNIRILHCHSTSLFIARIAAFFPPYPAVVWHDHYGRYAMEERPAWLYRLVASRVSGVIAVNQSLAEWSQHRLCIPAERVWYIPNFVYVAEPDKEPPTLPGTAGERIVCVANFRAQKDHCTLLRAMARVVYQAPSAHLLLVGAVGEPDYYALVREQIVQLGLEQNVSFLGERQDVFAILRVCDIGVLSSVSEGFPLTLLEYGTVGLPVVATSIGQCAEILDEGRAGILISPGSHDQLAQALLLLLRSPEQRSVFGRQLHRRIKNVYSPRSIIEHLLQVYDVVLKC
jgi:glycosyltransferase involved in cell wall biosynthesis